MFYLNQISLILLIKQDNKKLKKKLFENSSFHWDEDHSMPNANDNVWDKFLEKQPNEKEF